jgi:hypothetical protein
MDAIDTTTVQWPRGVDKSAGVLAPGMAYPPGLQASHSVRAGVCIFVPKLPAARPRATAFHLRKYHGKIRV